MPDAAASTREIYARSSCVTCPAAGHCPVECARQGLRAASGPAEPAIPLPHAGKVLYAAATPAFAIYVVRAGCVKTVTTDTEGNEHVRGFHFSGDLVGLDAIGAGHYPSSAVAVTPAQACRLSKGQLQQQMQTSPARLQQLMEHTSRELRQALALSGNYTAEQRVAAFLLEMEQRLTGSRGGEFTLPMTRRDMANHLRLATETVCRVLGRFVDHGWIRSNGTVKILKRSPLLDLARPVGISNNEVRLAA